MTNEEAMSGRGPRAYSPGLYSSGQPTPGDLAAFADAGVRTVINLRAPSEVAGFDEEREVSRLGLRYVAMPIAGPQALTPETTARFSKALERARLEGGVLVHCASGNRVGALVALDRGLTHRAPLAEALALGRAAGLVSLEERVIELLDAAQRQ